MRFVFIALAFVLAPQATFADLLSYEEIIENIEGTWGIPYDALDDEDVTIRCNRSPITIRLTEDDGVLKYEAWQLGDDYINRAQVQTVVRTDGSIAPFILLRYEGEERLTDSGEPVQWRLAMTDLDSFFWQRTDWPPNSWTAGRVRCQTSYMGT